MKKFLSLLLALTLVLSLVVVPARAAENEWAWKTEPTMTITKGGSPGETINSGTTAVKGTSLTFSVKNGTVQQSANDTTEVNSSTYDVSDDTVFKNAIKSHITYDGKAPAIDNTTGNLTAYKYTASAEWSVSAPVPSYTSITIVNPSITSGSLVIKGRDAHSHEVTATFTVQVTTPTFASITATINGQATPNQIISGGKVQLAVAGAAGLDTSGVYYVWTYSTDKPIVGTGASVTWDTSLLNLAAGDYTVTCKAMYGYGTNATLLNKESLTIKVIDDNFALYPATLTAISIPSSQSTNLPVVTLCSKNGNNQGSAVNGLTYTWSCASNAIAINNEASPKTATASASASGSYGLTVTTNYQGKTYTKSLTLSVSNLSATLTSVANGSSQNYYTSDLKAAAASAIAALPQVSGTVTVSSISVKTKPTLGSLNTTYINSSNGYVTYTAPKSSLGQDKFVTTVVTNKDTFEVTFVIPVIPIYNQTFEAQYPQAVASVGNSYNYTVTPPTGYDRIALITKGTTPTTAQLTTSPAYNSTSITLNSSDFNTTTGKCTLYVMAWNSNWTSNYYSTGKYYYGPLEVYQKNHDIKYNGVVGETVQFKHNDFTTFMNEMYGTNTTSYLTFNSVKFTSLPNATTQGTLYYNGSAMTTGYGSNYFNTSTAVTNLDNVSFAVSSKVPSTTKEIRIPFTLYATRYNSYGTSAGTSVTYSGVVVISLVREDVTFTVAPGDSVTFTDSDFLNYLRTQSGINYNYNIDYVTFDQSAVDTINGGVLYSGYAGYNQVKPTDKFYYTTTNNYTQNALSDVTFRASLYAKTGTTVYIPFTIYARYGTSSAATRQVTGTVAVKIAQTMNFVDVKPTDYFYNPVKWAVGKNITKGTSAVTFSPDRTCTRAEIVTFLWRDAGSPMPTITRNPFSDVNYSMGADFYNAILWASQNGITAGTDVSHFSPNKTCTRAEIVTFLWRYAKKPVGYGSNSFTDVNKTDHAPYYDAILWAVSKGITNGSTTTTFAPDGTCTRGQAVTFLYRYEGGM